MVTEKENKGLITLVAAKRITGWIKTGGRDTLFLHPILVYLFKVL